MYREPLQCANSTGRPTTYVDNCSGGWVPTGSVELVRAAGDLEVSSWRANGLLGFAIIWLQSRPV